MVRPSKYLEAPSRGAPGRQIPELEPRTRREKPPYKLFIPIEFLHVPPAMSQKPVERWSIPQFPFEVCQLTTYPPENIIAVVEMKEE